MKEIHLGEELRILNSKVSKSFKQWWLNRYVRIPPLNHSALYQDMNVLPHILLFKSTAWLISILFWITGRESYCWIGYKENFTTQSFSFWNCKEKDRSTSAEESLDKIFLYPLILVLISINLVSSRYQIKSRIQNCIPWCTGIPPDAADTLATIFYIIEKRCNIENIGMTIQRYNKLWRHLRLNLSV